MSSLPPTFTTGSAQPEPEPLALDRPKRLSELFRDAAILWRSHTGVFLMTSALIVIPYEVIVNGLLGGGFNDPLGEPAIWAQVASPLLLTLFGTSLITAIHSRAVVRLAQGESLTTGDAFTLGLAGFGTIVAAMLVYFLGVVIGLIAIVLPGVFLSIAGVFTAQIAALHGLGPVDALKASIRVVLGSGWWRTVGYLIVLNLVASIGLLIGIFALGIVSLATGENDGFGAIAVPVTAVIEAAVMSWSALATTLLYFSWRAEQGDPFGDGTQPPQGRLVPRPPRGSQGPAAPGGPTFTK